MFHHAAFNDLINMHYGSIADVLHLAPVVRERGLLTWHVHWHSVTSNPQPRATHRHSLCYLSLTINLGCFSNVLNNSNTARRTRLFRNDKNAHETIGRLSRPAVCHDRKFVYSPLSSYTRMDNGFHTPRCAFVRGRRGRRGWSGNRLV